MTSFPVFFSTGLDERVRYELTWRLDTLGARDNFPPVEIVAKRLKILHLGGKLKILIFFATIFAVENCTTHLVINDNSGGEGPVPNGRLQWRDLDRPIRKCVRGPRSFLTNALFGHLAKARVCLHIHRTMRAAGTSQITEKLPPELLEEILRRVSVPDIIRLNQVEKQSGCVQRSQLNFKRPLL